MLTRLALVVVILFGGSATLFAYSRSDAWVPQTNSRFGFTFSYPADIFQVERSAGDGSGMAFVSTDGTARMLVGGLENRDDFTLESYRSFIRDKSYSNFNVHYAPRGHSWFVLSGETAERVFYEKVIFGCGGRIINRFALIYPVRSKAIFDPIVERLEDSFRIAKDCARYGY